MDSTIPKLIEYKHAIDIDDFIDFLYSKKIISEENYYEIWSKYGDGKFNELYRIVKAKDRSDLQIIFEYLHTRYPHIKNQVKEDQNFREVSVRGGFPVLPSNYVCRKSLVEDLKNKLVNIQWNKKLIVHGMMGYGKSCLVNKVLEDDTVRKYFDDHIFWINLGEHRTTENILQPLWRLYVTVCIILQMKILHSFGDVQMLKTHLIRLFLDSRLSTSLIILDDACNEEVLTYFDFKCKTLITTQNKKILPRESGIYLEVKTGFSRNESLELFKNSLNANYDLPEYAEEIHNICKGHPMLISLIGSYLNENAESAKDDSKIWQYIKNMFLKGAYRLNDYDINANIPEMIKQCIDVLLPDNLKELYYDLAIFMEDVNIFPEVLEVLWNEDKFTVNNIMNKFAEKSLLVRFYHADRKTYIYGIHDIYLNCIKEITGHKITSLHKKLISGYDRITNKNYENLPNDNYTLQFIGYHLYKAEAFKRFDIYFNLKFLEAKLRAVGKEDVLQDMKKYEKFITRKSKDLEKKLEELKEFIERCGGNIYSYEKTDIIQFALKEDKEKLIFKDALAYAEKSDKLYFQLQKPVDEFDYSHTINIKDDITCACFVNSRHRILIGQTNGSIMLFHEQPEKKISNFKYHEGPIKKLIISPCKQYFLSLSEDGTVALWKFAAESARNSIDFSDNHPGSPKTKQHDHLDIFTSDKGILKPKRRFKLNEIDDSITTAAFCDQFPTINRIVTGSKRGNVIIWDVETGSNLYKTGHRGFIIPAVMYLENELMNGVIFSCDDNIIEFQFHDNKFQYHGSLHNKEHCNALFVNGKQIIAVYENNVILWQNHKPLKTFQKPVLDKQNICATLTNDGKYLIFSTNLNTVCVLDVHKWKLVKEFKSNGLAKSLDTFYDDDKSVHILLIGSDKKTLKQCHILPSESEPQIANAPIFIPHWKKKHALTAVVSLENKIQVFRDYIEISETDVIESQVTYTCFSVCGDKVVYGLEDGKIYSFNLLSKVKTCIEDNKNNKNGPVTYLRCYDPNNIDTHSTISAGSGEILDSNYFYNGIIVAVFDFNLIKVYNDKNIFSRKVDRPLIFFKSNNLILVDISCKIYIWNLEENLLSPLKNPLILEPVKVTTATFCTEKNLIGVVYKQNDGFFLDIYYISVQNATMELHNRIDIRIEGKSSCFSCDGSLLAVGLISGDIMVWNMNQNFKSIKLELHNEPVENLIFSPTMEPILVSLGEEIAWWSLKSFLRLPQKSGRPKSIDILESVSTDMLSMDLSFWSERKCLKDEEYLLSCIKLHGKGTYVSASNDFNSFLTVDDKGNINIMEIVPSRA